ncbi:MAG: undecaprenyl/decaprenyl-phosphate alpha-N-acetylglucosaminyl 1-phosphate transferase [Chloroflexi bacterium]|nr:undecaprenyl/decaprenyl-phosphate alpha-N-acetylglucosaminyl 1-phosphate transferase [Chloroflexota bacterium]
MSPSGGINPAPWLIGAFLAALAATYLLVLMAEHAGERLGVVDAPRPGEVQDRVIPRTGGYAMLGGLWLALALGYAARGWFLSSPGEGADWNAEDDQRMLGIVLGTLAIVPLALLDDRRRLGPWPQLVGQVVVASIPVAFGLRVSSIAQPFGDPLKLPLWLDVPVSVLWFVGMMNAINWVDVMDGLASGITIMGALVLAARALLFLQFSVALFPLVLAGVCLGFLGRNRPPASIFMGTSGSLLLGFGLAASGILGGAKVGTAILVMGVPILDAAWVIFRRLTRGARPQLGGDREHLPMKLHDLGLSTRNTVLVLYAVSAVLGTLGLSLHTAPEAPSIEKAYVLAGMVVVILGALALITFAVTRRRERVRSG